MEKKTHTHTHTRNPSCHLFSVLYLRKMSVCLFALILSALALQMRRSERAACGHLAALLRGLQDAALWRCSCGRLLDHHPAAHVHTTSRTQCPQAWNWTSVPFNNPKPRSPRSRFVPHCPLSLHSETRSCLRPFTGPTFLKHMLRDYFSVMRWTHPLRLGKAREGLWGASTARWDSETGLISGAFLPLLDYLSTDLRRPQRYKQILAGWVRLTKQACAIWIAAVWHMYQQYLCQP